jgi:phage recombination protein Bet
MTNLTTTQGQSSLAIRQYDQEKIELIKQTICKDATDVELQFFLEACKHTNLDPFMKQIYAVKRQGKMTIQTGIDGYRLMAHRSGVYAGSDEPVFKFEKDSHIPVSATVTVWKFVQGQRCAFVGTAYWSEYCPPPGQDHMWKKMPRGQLAKCAEAQALRKAFPAELSGVYVEEEMQRADAEEVKAKEGAIEVEVVDYAAKEKIVTEIKALLASLTKNLTTIQDKGAFMLKYAKVRSFDELNKKSTEDLQAISKTLQDLISVANKPSGEAQTSWPEL